MEELFPLKVWRAPPAPGRPRKQAAAATSLEVALSLAAELRAHQTGHRRYRSQSCDAPRSYNDIVIVDQSLPTCSAEQQRHTLWLVAS